MSSPEKLYVKGIREKLKIYYAAWLPNENLRLGDVVVLEENLFKRTTSLKDFGITFTKRRDTHSTPIILASGTGVDISFKAAGELNTNMPHIPQVNAGLKVKFNQKGAFVFHARESYESSIENIAQLQEQIAQMSDNKNWKENLAVIVKLVSCPKATILISRSSTSDIELTALGNVSTVPFNLGDSNIDLEVNNQNGDILSMPSASKITPFFQLLGFKKNIWKPWEYEKEPEFMAKKSKIMTLEDLRKRTAIKREDVE